MNKTKIDYGHYCWNPLEGCRHGCLYCYARKRIERFGGNFAPTYYPERLGDPMKQKPGRVLVCFQGDLFGDWVDVNFTQKIINKTLEHPEHRFIFLTKNPERYHYLYFPNNCWLGFTIDSMNWRNSRKFAYFGNGYSNRFLSFEPLQTPIPNIYIQKTDWVIVGGMTPRNVHKTEWVERIVAQCREQKIPVYLKNNLHFKEKIQEYPEGLKVPRDLE